MLNATRRSFLQTSLMGTASTLFSPQSFSQSSHRYNILFIAVDDLRPQLGCYGNPYMKTPNLDRLASEGILFERAYCQQAVCSPSRTSLLTGLRPDTTQVFDLVTHFRLNIPNAVTLPQYFRINGYYTQALSKIFHSGLDDPESWSVRHWAPTTPEYGNPEILNTMNQEKQELQSNLEGPVIDILEKDGKTGQPLKITRPKYRVRGPSWESAQVSDSNLPDGETADRAIELLNALKDQCFFLAVGFLKPHLPFVAPQKYFDLYPFESVPLPKNPHPPQNAPDIAFHNFGELRNYNDIPKEGPLTEHKTLELIRAYAAATSYVDAQIGRVIDELDRLGLRQKTIVVVWGDHGWHLGDHALWCKHTNFEAATRAPLLISSPGMSQTNLKINRLVEFVDIYPTLCELCEFPIPPGLEGISLVPLMNNPEQLWKKAAFSQYPRGQDIMGYSMRTDQYRYTEWIKKGEEKPVSIELYDYLIDPDEKENAAARPEYKDRIDQLKTMLQDGWQHAFPPGYNPQ